MTTPTLHRDTDTTGVSPLVAAALLRVSRTKRNKADKARDDWTRERSLPQQLDAARAVTDVGGHPVLLTDDALYSEEQSASRFATKTRKAFAELDAAVRAGRYQLIVAWEIDRLSRELEAWAGFLNACRARGVLIHVLTHRRTYDPRIARDWRSLADDGTDAAYFSEKLSMNIKRGHADSIDRGRPGGQAPYGYTRVYDGPNGSLGFDEATGWHQVPNDDAETVKQIIEAVAARTPLNRIERDLHARGIMLGRSTITSIARRPAYAALRPAGDELKPGRWVPIVDAATWRRAQDVLAGNREGSRPGRVVWLLSGVGDCACGAAGSWKGQQGKGNTAATYFCRICGTKVNAAQADQYVTALALTRLSEPDAAAQLLTDDTSEEAAAARAEVSRLKDKLARHRDRLEAATSASEEEEEREQIRRLKPKITAAEKRAERLSTPPALEGWADVLGNEEAVIERWQASSLPARKDVLRVVFERLELGRAAFRGQLADDRITHRWREAH